MLVASRYNRGTIHASICHVLERIADQGIFSCETFAIIADVPSRIDCSIAVIGLRYSTASA